MLGTIKDPKFFTGGILETTQDAIVTTPEGFWKTLDANYLSFCAKGIIKPLKTKPDVFMRISSNLNCLKLISNKCMISI